MKKYLFLWIFPILSFGQKVTIFDNSSNEVIPFVSVSDGARFVYADLNGMAVLDIFKDNNNLTFSAVGYKNFKVKKSNIKEELNLEIDLIQLDAIVLDVKKQKVVQTKKMKRKGILGNQIIPCHYGITTMVLPKESLINKKIKSIELKFKRHKGHSSSQKDRYKGFDIMIRLNIYSRKNESVAELLYTSKPLSIDAGEKDEITFDVNNVNFLEEGFYLQLEHLGSVDSDGALVDCDNLHLIRPEIADTKSNEYDIASYLLEAVGKVNFNESLNYKTLLLPNGETGDYYLNYRFSYYD
jgi:hypothetical protein